MSNNSRSTSTGIIVLVVGLVLLVPCVLGALGLAGMLFYLRASPAPPPVPPSIQAVSETPVDTTEADDPTKITFEVKPDEWPLNEPIVRRGAIAVFSSQAGEDWGGDADFLETLKLGDCAYGAASCPVYPFICKVQSSANQLTGRDILQAVKAKHFRSQHITSLDRADIPFPGYHPGTENDEVHNDFAEQFVFTHEDGIGEFDGAHGALKRYVADGRLWYVLLHTTPQPHDEFMFSEYVILFVLGKSPHGDSCVGVVTHQVCHNLCD